MIKPYIIYSVINVLFVILAKQNIGMLKSDTIDGFILSWLIFTFVLLYMKMFRNLINVSSK